MGFSMNTSSGNQTLYTYPELVFTAVGFCVLSTVAIVGNSLVLMAVARSKRLQTVTNVFVVNLSVSDCLASFAILWSVPGMVSKTDGYPLGSEVPCLLSAGLVFTTVAGGLYSLANIALNRCILVTRPRETYQWLYTPKKIALMVLASWLVPFCATSVPPLSGVGDLGFDFESRTCTDLDIHPKAAIYDKIQFAAFFPLPLIAIVISYAILWRHVRRHFKNQQKQQQSRGGTLQSSCREVHSTLPSTASRLDIDGTSVGCSRSGPAASSLRRAESTRSVNRRTRNDQMAVTKNLFVVVFTFLVCFTPLAIMVVLKSQRYQLYGGLMLFVSSSLNPLIYATRHPHFKPVLLSMVRCRLSR